MFKPLTFALIVFQLVAWEAVFAEKKRRLGDLPEEKEKSPKKAIPPKETSTPEEKMKMMSEVVDNFYKKGLQALKEGRLDKAEAFFDRVLILQPNHAGARNGINRIMRVIEEQNPIKKKSDQKTDTLAKLDKELDEQLKKGQWEKATTTAKRIVALDPNHVKAKSAIVTINRNLYQQAIERAKQKEKDGQWEAAIDSYQMAMGYRMDPSLRENIGRLREKIKGRNEKKSDALYLQALTASQEGNTATALDLCQKSLDLNPQNLQAQRMMQRLKLKPTP